MKNETVGKNMPEIKFKAGAVSATVWPNKGQTKDGILSEFKTISIERSYKDKNNQWQKTSQLRVNDLPKAALILNKAYEYIVLNQQYGAGAMQEI